MDKKLELNDDTKDKLAKMINKCDNTISFKDLDKHNPKSKKSTSSQSNNESIAFLLIEAAELLNEQINGNKILDKIEKINEKIINSKTVNKVLDKVEKTGDSCFCEKYFSNDLSDVKINIVKAFPIDKTDAEKLCKYINKNKKDIFSIFAKYIFKDSYIKNKYESINKVLDNLEVKKITLYGKYTSNTHISTASIYFNIHSNKNIVVSLENNNIELHKVETNFV